MLLILLLLAAGAIAGLLSGFFGVGGGLILVPAVLFSLHFTGLPSEMHMHIALATSLTTILINSLFSARKHNKNKNIRWDLVTAMSVGVGGGAIIGSLSTSFLDTQWLTLVFCLFTIYTAIELIKKSLRPGKYNAIPNMEGFEPYNRPHLIFGGIGIGWISSLVGIGGGSLTVPMLAKHAEMKQAVASSTLVAIPLALFSMLTYMLTGWQQTSDYALTTGYIYWPAVIALTATGTICSHFGASWADKVKEQYLKTGFSCLLLIIVVAIFFQAIS